MSGIVNRVEASGIITLDLEELIPDRTRSYIDIKDQLFKGLILKEKDFRSWVKQHDWSQYNNQDVAVYCSADAVVPTWAYMLIATAISPITSSIYFTQPDNLSAMVAERAVSQIDTQQYSDSRVVIKGCGNRDISNHAYVMLTSKLTSVAKSVMFGEPCSTVPVYKKR
jgi:protoporphyrinogen oxidase